jgi:hypothetical protein
MIGACVIIAMHFSLSFRALLPRSFRLHTSCSAPNAVFLFGLLCLIHLALGKERAGQVGQLAQKFEQEAQQALKHAEESAPKPKLTRTFSYKEKQPTILPSHSATSLLSPSARTAVRFPFRTATQKFHILSQNAF